MARLHVCSLGMIPSPVVLHCSFFVIQEALCFLKNSLTTSEDTWENMLFFRVEEVYGSEGKNPICNAGDKGDVGLIPGSGRSPGGGLLLYSYGENSMDRRAQWATAHGVAKELDRIEHGWDRQRSF